MNKLQELYEKETGKYWMTNPVAHGELEFASWDYQVWLEKKASQLELLVQEIVDIIDNLIIEEDDRQLYWETNKAKELVTEARTSIKILEKLKQKIKESNV